MYIMYFNFFHCILYYTCTKKVFKILNTFLIVLKKMLVIRAGSHKMLIRIANREYPDQTASSEAV